MLQSGKQPSFSLKGTQSDKTVGVGRADKGRKPEGPPGQMPQHPTLEGRMVRSHAATLTAVFWGHFQCFHRPGLTALTLRKWIPQILSVKS